MFARKLVRGKPPLWNRWKIGFILAAAPLLILACTTLGYNSDTELNCQNCGVLEVHEVIDGDTLDTDQGRVRLFGVDAPEQGEKCYSEATRALADLAGNTVKWERGARIEDEFGRPLYYLYTEDSRSIDELLVRGGSVTAWSKDGQHRDFLVRLEIEARRNKQGCLWEG